MGRCVPNLTGDRSSKMYQGVGVSKHQEMVELVVELFVQSAKDQGDFGGALGAN